MQFDAKLWVLSFVFVPSLKAKPDYVHIIPLLSMLILVCCFLKLWRIRTHLWRQAATVETFLQVRIGYHISYLNVVVILTY